MVDFRVRGVRRFTASKLVYGFSRLENPESKYGHIPHYWSEILYRYTWALGISDLNFPNIKKFSASKQFPGPSSVHSYGISYGKTHFWIA